MSTKNTVDVDATLPPQRILLAEDDQELSRIWREYLTTNLYDVTVVDNVADAIVELNETEYDLLITDIYFRRDGTIDKDGGVTLINRVRLENIKSPDKSRRIPIIAVTGTAGTLGTFQFNAITTVNYLIESGLQKPLRLESLLSAVEELLSPPGD